MGRILQRGKGCLHLSSSDWGTELTGKGEKRNKKRKKGRKFSLLSPMIYTVSYAFPNVSGSSFEI